jgi:hypothetical protein
MVECLGKEDSVPIELSGSELASQTVIITKETRHSRR